MVCSARIGVVVPAKPLCAWCGGSLTARAMKADDGATVVIDHRRDPHRPRYGWHVRCLAPDPLSWSGEAPALSVAQLRVVEARGPGRVVRRQRGYTRARAAREGSCR